MKFYKILFLFFSFTPIHSFSQAPSPEDVCNATITFLNDLMATDYVNYKSDLVVDDVSALNYKSYVSTINFPGALNTVIFEPTTSSPFRSAKVTYAEEFIDSKEISPRMIELYKNMSALFGACLEPNKFTTTNNDNNELKLYPFESKFTLDLENDNLFDVSYLMATVYVDVTIHPDGKQYIHRLMIRFRRA